MKHLFSILLIGAALCSFSISSTAQIKKDNKYKPLMDAAAKEMKADTASIKLTDREISILQSYSTKYAEAVQELQRVQRAMQELKDNYNNVLGMRVEAAGGNSKKEFSVDGVRLKFSKQ